MKNLRVILTLLNILSFTQLYSQDEFNNSDAINVYKILPPKYGFEGVYEIYFRSGHKLAHTSDPNNDYDNISNQEYTTENVKVCIYTGSTGQIYFKLITEGIPTDNKNKVFYYNWFASSKSKYKVDAFGILTNIIHYDAKYLELNEDQDFVTRIYNVNSTLLYDVKVYGVKFEYNNYDYIWDNRWQFMLKKVYTPLNAN